MAFTQEQEEQITVFALENAIKFKGKANPKAVLGQTLGNIDGARDDMKTTATTVNQIVAKINALSLEQIQIQLTEKKPDWQQEKKQEKKQRQEQRLELPPLPHAKDGEVVLRIPPEPSKYAHVGHAASFLINYMYAKKYNGKVYIRFDDTNPAKSTQEYVDALLDDCQNYLGITDAKVVFASDDMETFYDYAAKLIEMNKAYVDFSDGETMSKGRREGIDSEYRNTSVEENKKLWEDMLAGKYKDGDCALRLKADMQHKNAVMRDPIIFRISTHPHYRHAQKYCIWPLYDFETVIEEELLGITHLLRSAEFDARIELQDYIRDLLGFKKQTAVQYGRINIKGATTKGREIRELIETGQMTGWDDPRLVTLKALKRKGIVKEALQDLAITVGMSKQQTTVDFITLAKFNKQHLDATVDRYYFVQDAQKITVKNTPAKEVSLNLHPDRKGGRVMTITEGQCDFFITKEDHDAWQVDEVVRFIDAVNVKKTGDASFEVVSESFDDFKAAGGKKVIHYLCAADNLQEISVIMPDASTIVGLAEAGIEQIQSGQIVQFERFGFARLDNKSQERSEFIYAHR